MDVDFAILADGVAQRPDGKLDLFGAGFDNIFATQVPAAHPVFTLALRLLLSRHEAENPHRLNVILMSADGAQLASATAELTEIPADQLDQVQAGRRIGIGVVLTMANVVFPAYGIYHFAIHWDGNEARPPIVITVSPATPRE
jgi:hypothetical protein